MMSLEERNRKVEELIETLTEDIDRIANFLHDNETNVILIDSLGQAAGSDRFDTAGKGAALKFFEALRLLNVTSLIIAQNAKNTEEGGKKTIYGSTFFTYYARNVLELRGKPDGLNEDIMHCVFIHQESNYSKRHQPMGLRLEYTTESINITEEPVLASEWFEKASQMNHLLEFLKSGAKTRTAIANELGKPIGHVDVLLARAKKRGLAIALGSGMWGLPVVESSEHNS